MTFNPCGYQKSKQSICRDGKVQILIWFQTFLALHNTLFSDFSCSLNALKSTSFEAFQIISDFFSQMLSHPFIWKSGPKTTEGHTCSQKTKYLICQCGMVCRWYGMCMDGYGTLHKRTKPALWLTWKDLYFEWLFQWYMCDLWMVWHHSFSKRIYWKTMNKEKYGQPCISQIL